VPVKNVVIPLKVEYLEEAAKVRGISRTRLVQIVMEKVVREKLVKAVLGDSDLPYPDPRKPRYRRFKP
jgi:hypothetical protein